MYIVKHILLCLSYFPRSKSGQTKQTGQCCQVFIHANTSRKNN